MGVYFVSGDLCHFGLQVSPEGPSKKPTGFLTNSIEIARELYLRCPGDHHHCRLPHGLAHLAQEYTPAFG